MNDHITEVLIDQHWFKIEERIVYKLLILSFKAFIVRTAPLYLCELITISMLFQQLACYMFL